MCHLLVEVALILYNDHIFLRSISKVTATPTWIAERLLSDFFIHTWHRTPQILQKQPLQSNIYKATLNMRTLSAGFVMAFAVFHSRRVAAFTAAKFAQQVATSTTTRSRDPAFNLLMVTEVSVEQENMSSRGCLGKRATFIAMVHCQVGIKFSFVHVLLLSCSSTDNGIDRH